MYIGIAAVMALATYALLRLCDSLSQDSKGDHS
jgi:hypothetical protein